MCTTLTACLEEKCAYFLGERVLILSARTVSTCLVKRYATRNCLFEGIALSSRDYLIDSANAVCLEVMQRRMVFCFLRCHRFCRV